MARALGFANQVVYKKKMPDLTLKDIRIHYRISGKGPALLLIGGMGMPMQGWALQARELSKYCTVIRFDNRGCGRSTVPEQAYTIEDMAGDSLGLLDHLGIPKAHVMGGSMGGCIALALARKAPQRIASLVLAHTAPALPQLARQRLRLWLGLMDQGICARLMAMEQLIWMFPETAMEEDEAKALIRTLEQGQTHLTPMGFRGQARAMETFDLTPFIQEICIPSLLISSRDDLCIPLSHTRKLEAMKGFQRIKIFGDGGHVTHLRHAPAFNRTVMEFIRDVTEVPGPFFFRRSVHP